MARAATRASQRMDRLREHIGDEVLVMVSTPSGSAPVMGVLRAVNGFSNIDVGRGNGMSNGVPYDMVRGSEDTIPFIGPSRAIRAVFSARGEEILYDNRENVRGRCKSRSPAEVYALARISFGQRVADDLARDGSAKRILRVERVLLAPGALRAVKAD